MLVFKLKAYLQECGKQYPHEWLVKVCGFNRGKAYVLLNGKQKSVSTLDLSVLCEKLNCTPNDLYYWHNTPRLTLPNSHPVFAKLQPPLAVNNWADALKHFTPAQARQLLIETNSKIEDLQKKEV